MMKQNPCCTGDTLVVTANGLVRFDELAKADNDVDVLCYDEKGEIVLSKMLHPRISGYKQQIVKITLEDGTVLKTTPNHEFLTDNGYCAVEDLFEDDLLIVNDGNIMEVPYGIHESLTPWTELEATKKGSILKKSEVTNETIEVDWEEREIACEEDKQDALSEKVYVIHEHIENATKDYNTMRIKSVEFLSDKENVYNGTVVKLHNYFTYDANTHTVVNQKNCGE